MNPTTTAMQHGKVPPQATEVEAVLLAGIMTDWESYEKVAPLITQESFYLDHNKIIYAAIQSLAKRGRPTDMVMVTQELRDTGRLEEVGGPLAIAQITNKSFLAHSIEDTAKIVAQKFIQRELIRIGMETVQAGFDDTTDIEDQLVALKTKLDEVENIAISTHPGNSQVDTLSGAIREIEEDCANFKVGKPAGVPTGLSLLDIMTGGWRKTNLIILAARPGIGKTSLALHFAKVAARAGEWVNFYGLEMTSTDLMRIQISGECDVRRSDIRDGRLQDQDWDQINMAATRLEKLPIVWYDNAGITVAQIKANTKRNIKRGRCKLVVIDYLQLMTPTDKKNPSREQQISEITGSLKRLALEMKIPIICLSQLNRDASEREPALHHLRESGAIEQDADVVVMPWREEKIYKISILKNRRGSLGKFNITANEEMTRFSNGESSNQQNPPPYQQPVPGPDNRIQPNEIPF